MFFDLLKASVSPFECVKFSADFLMENGFTKLEYTDNWLDLKKGGKYVVNHHGTTLFAFTVGTSYQSGDMLRLAAAHTDYPCLRLKPNPDFETKGYGQVNVEVYGGPILNTWFDRPLGVAGRVVTKSEDPFAPNISYYVSQKPLMTIPNLAIHMNREVNKGVEINNQIDLMPITSLDGTKENFLSYLAEELHVKCDDILDFELNTFIMDNPSDVGLSDDMLLSPRLDNQTSVWALLSGITKATRSNGINLIALFDHEEIGSSSKQGAASILLHDMAKRILRSLGESEDSIDAIIYDGMLLSVDVAHALHPNKVGKMDPINQPVLGKGFCIKEACSQSYATDSEAIGILCQLCQKNDIPYQRFVNRSDVRGGGTLGAIASTLLPLKTVDLGVPILAMHSSCELMGKKDMEALESVVKAFFS